MTGAGHEAGETARGFIDAMKAQPALLAMIVLNFAMLVFIFFMTKSSYAAWETHNNYRIEVGREVLRYVGETNRLLAQCTTIPAEQIPKPPEIK